ncbi:MAG: eukaryotic-like serine/threonine-protein kinase, partial [Thermoleophilaceae bacterium]|nr:eukaryotic-like serine/threonine-protein kinase [Thermoleophilaceae bacterium]
PIEPGRAVQVLRDVAEALDHAHEEGIVHRDVKPANVLVGRDGRAKLADLGIATAVEGTRITRSGTVLGTAAYMAPEQLEGHKPGPEADVYSLAVVAWEALSGRRAYDGRTPLQIAHRKATDPPPALDEAWPAAPVPTVELLERAMGPDPAARPRTASALVDELERTLAAAPRTAATAPLRKRPAAAAPAPAALPVADREPAPRTLYVLQPGEGGRGRRPWLVPFAALLVGAVVVAALLFSSGGGPSDHAGRTTVAGKKSSRAPKKKQATPPANSQPAQPAPASPSSGYQVPQAAGGSATKAQSLNAQGKALSDRGDYAAAIPVLERALKSYPAGTTASDLNFAYTLFNLGHALNAGGRPADAIPVLEERLKNPDQSATVQKELDAARAAAGQG